MAIALRAQSTFVASKRGGRGKAMGDSDGLTIRLHGFAPDIPMIEYCAFCFHLAIFVEVRLP